MTRSTDNPWLNRFAVFTAMATLCLIAIGGLVTSHGVGMAVPDWPTTYGYNMFLFPVSKWVGGIFYEHTHRLFASFVGFLTMTLAVWLWLKESRRWLRWLGVAALFAVVLQGVLGGLRVTLIKDQIGVFHAALAQLFLVLVSLIALFSSRTWRRIQPRAPLASSAPRRWSIAATALIFTQLVLGASMRHQHAGLAVPDFPLAYSKIWPPMDDASLDAINRHRTDIRDFKPIAAFHIGLHMAHRIGALLALAAVSGFAWTARQEFGGNSWAARIGFVWLMLLVSQAVLGAATVWSNKAADVATAHVVLGAASLVLGSLFLAVLLRQLTSAETRRAIEPRLAASLPRAKPVPSAT